MSLPNRTPFNTVQILLLMVALSAIPVFAISQNVPARRLPPNLPSNFNRLAGPQSVVEIPLELMDPNPASVRLRLGNPPLTVNEVTWNDEPFSWVRMDGEGSTLDEGAPDLPRVSRLIMISNTGNVGVQIESQHYRIEQLPHPPAPYHRELAGEAGALDGYSGASPDPRYYTQDSWYPAQPVEISPPMVLRDVRFVILLVYPVQVNPVTGEMRVFDRLDVALNNLGGSGENEITFQPQSISPAFKKLYNAFLNFPGSALDALPVAPGRHLYISQDNLSINGQVNRLIKWRRKKGIDAYVAYTTQTGTLASDIRLFIQNEYDNSNGQLEYVTLVGDPTTANPYYLATDNDGLYDSYFAALSGGPNPDPLQDVAVGRLPAITSGQLAAMVSKTVLYESDPYLADTTWFTRAYCASHTTIIPSNPSTKEYTRQIMLQSSMTEVTADTFYGYIDPTQYAARINQGICVLNHRLSHNAEMNSADILGLVNGRMNPFVCEISCGYGWFTHGGDPYQDVTKVWLQLGSSSAPNGAIGCVGMASTSTWVAENNILDAGMMYGLFALDIHEQGLVLMSGELQLFRQYWGYGRENDVNIFTYWANLMGDPATPIWLEVPHAPVVVAADTVRVGQNNLSVTVQLQGQPAAAALVGLLKGSETFARGYTDANGTINLPLNIATTSDTLFLTVTREDLDTYLDTIRVVQPAQWLAYQSTTVDDDNVGGTVGDGNGVLNPGETIDLGISLRNSGNLQTATGIHATLSSASSGVTIVSPFSDYPNIIPGATQSPLTPYRIQVGAVFNGEPIQLFLTTTGSAGTQSNRIDLTPIAGDVAFTATSFPDGNNRLDPGDAGNYLLTFTNTGTRALVNAAGILRSLDSRLTISDSLGSFGTVSAAANATNSGDPFAITASGLTFGGLQLPLELVVTDANGLRDSIDFYETVGVVATTSPTGPDAYGYYAYDNTELQPVGGACAYDWVEVAPTQGGPGFALNLADLEEDSDQVVVQTLPFPFRFYGEEFTQLTICTNGWIAFGAYGIDDFRNYRVGSPLGPPFMVAAYWDDLVTRGWSPGGDVYVYSDIPGGRYIVEWIARTLNYSVEQVFQIVLLNPAVYPSAGGDGKILVQYQSVTPDANHNFNDNDWATVGIQNGNHSIGLEYSWYNTYPPTAAPLVNGRAIMYTTDPAGVLFSELTVTVPNGGEIFMRDSTASIAWYPASVAGNVNIELSRNGALGPYTTIMANTPNDGLESWLVTGPSTADARIRIVPVSDPAAADSSDANFSIAQIVTLISEDFESGAPGWTHASAGGPWVDDWHISTERAFSGTSSYKCGDPGAGTYRAFNDASLLSPTIADLPAAAMLQFVFQIESEISGAFPDSAYDGAVVELSADGGAFTEIAPLAQYPRTFRWERGGGLPALGPMRGQPCYAGDILTWSDALFDLNAYAGQDIQLRFRFGSDSLNYREGWYIDNVQLFAPAVIPPPPVDPIQVTLIQNGAVLTLRWFDDTNTQYRVYSSDTPAGPLTLVGSTSTTSLVVPGGAAAARKFYVVTGWDGNP